MENRGKNVKWWQVLIGAGVAAVVTVGAITGINTFRADQEAQAVAAEQAEIQAAAEAEYEAIVVKFSESTVVELVKVPPPPPEPVVVEEAPVEEGSGDGGYVAGQSGDPVPFIPSTDPNNANGGDYIDPGVYCLNGSASGNPPICD